MTAIMVNKLCITKLITMQEILNTFFNYILMLVRSVVITPKILGSKVE